MKFIFFILIVCVPFYNCKKEALPKAIIGRWELRESFSAGSYSAHQQHTAGNGDTFTFATYSFSQDTAGNYFRSGSYKIIQDTMLYAKQVARRLVLGQGFSDPFIKIEDNIMLLTYEGRDESTIMKYQRIK